MNSAINLPLKTIPKTDFRTPKPPKAPEKPLMPYMRYSRKVWERVKVENPQLKLWEVGRIIGQMWRELPDEEKSAYVEEYESEKLPYSEALRQYHSSPAYQAWIVAKERAEKMEDECDLDRKIQSRFRDKHESMPTDLRESYILEDNEEDSDEQFTVKHVAAARFQRNHRLMQEILSDSKLPNPGQLITKMRLHTLRMQVIQLNNHKSNLCSEIENCEFRHQTKMRKITDHSASFYADYRKLISMAPRITESQFTEMMVKAKQDLAREEEAERQRTLVEAEARRCLEQQRQQRKTEILVAESEQRHQVYVQQQKQIGLHQSQYLQQQQLHQQMPNLVDENSQKKDLLQREQPSSLDHNETQNSLPDAGYPISNRARFTGHATIPSGDMPAKEFRQPPQQCVYQPIQVPMQRPESRMQAYGSSRPQPLPNLQRGYGNIPQSPSVFTQGPPSCMAGMLSNQPHPSPPQYSYVPTTVVTNTSFSQPLSIKQGQPSDIVDSSNILSYPAEASPFYNHLKQSASEFMQHSSRKEAISESTLPPSDVGLNMGLVSSKKRKKSSIVAKDKKLNQLDPQRLNIPSMEIDQNMHVGDRGPKSHSAMFQQGYFDEPSRQGSPSLLSGTAGQFQYQQQQPSPRYTNSQASVINEGRLIGQNFIQGQNFYQPVMQGFSQQIRPYQNQPGIYGGPAPQQHSNYPNQQSQSVLYQHPVQASSQLIHNQAANPNSGSINWHAQQSMSQPQQPHPVSGSGNYPTQYGGQQGVVRYSVPSGIGYQPRSAFQNQPNVPDVVIPQQQPGPAPPPYHQSAVHHGYWQVQGQQQPLPGHLMQQGPEIVSHNQFPVESDRNTQSDISMRCQQQQIPVSMPAIGSGHVNSSAGGYYQAYSSSQNVYAPQGPSNQPTNNYYISSSPNMNYEGQFYTHRQQGNVWNSYPALQHDVPASGPYLPSQPISHLGQQRAMILQSDRQMSGLIVQSPSHKQDMQVVSPASGLVGSRPESVAAAPGVCQSKSQSTTPNSNL